VKSCIIYRTKIKISAAAQTVTTVWIVVTGDIFTDVALSKTQIQRPEFKLWLTNFTAGLWFSSANYTWF